MREDEKRMKCMNLDVERSSELLCKSIGITANTSFGLGADQILESALQSISEQIGLDLLPAFSIEESETLNNDVITAVMKKIDDITETLAVVQGNTFSINATDDFEIAIKPH